MDERERALREEARQRLTGIAKGLVSVVGVVATAQLVAGTLLGLLLGTVGRVATLEFLRDLEDQVAGDHPENSELP